MRRQTPFALAAVSLAGLTLPRADSAQDVPRPVAGGGVFVLEWKGQIDAQEERQGAKLSDSKLIKEGDALHVTTGPAVIYWNPANVARGDYTVRATFREPRYMNLNNHPHPYGIVIAGNDFGTDQQSLLYCATYGNGNVIVRGFGPLPFQLNGRGGERNAAVHKPAGPGQPVEQEIAVSVKGYKISCAVNGTVIGSYDKAAAVTAGKLKSTDGVYGIRFAHNTEGLVTGLTLTKQ